MIHTIFLDTFYFQSDHQLPTLNLLQADRSSLVHFDWTLLSNVVHAFDNFIPIEETKQTIAHLSICPLGVPLDMSQVLSMFTNFYTSAESFIGCTADFQVLTVGEKCSLYQRNLHGVLNLCATLILRLSGMFDSSTNEHIIMGVYGYDIFQQTKRIALQLDCDLIIIKLTLFILAFSSNCYMVDEHENMHHDSLLHGTFRLFGSQNVFVEILWKYMIHRYGYRDTVLRFSALVKQTLDLISLVVNMYRSDKLHQYFVDHTITKATSTIKLDENNSIPLWGKIPIIKNEFDSMDY
jgi:hypothetical protein